MTTSFEEFLRILNLKPLGDDVFEGESTHKSWKRIFGGQVIGQCVIAAQKTVEPQFIAHSLHCYFIRPGDQNIPIRFEVERMRDGRSFATRRVVALQNDTVIFTIAVSFHIKENGYDHQLEMPEAIAPEELPSEKESVANFPSVPQDIVDGWVEERPIEMRFADSTAYFDQERRSTSNKIWFRFKHPIDGDDAKRQAVLAYVSDYALLGTALFPHGKRFYNSDVMGASLDHSIWFHRPVVLDDWLLYHMETPSASGGRGFCRGSIFDRKGTLIASVAQEGLVRPIDPNRVKKK